MRKMGVFYDNISIAQLKKILEGFSDNDTLSIAIEMKKKPNTTSPSKPIVITQPGTPPPPLLPSTFAPTCQAIPIVIKLYPLKSGRVSTMKHRKPKSMIGIVHGGINSSALDKKLKLNK